MQNNNETRKHEKNEQYVTMNWQDLGKVFKGQKPQNTISSKNLEY